MSAAYQIEPWHDLFVTVGGAAAALAGLLFVAMSLNLEHILERRSLPSLGARAVAALVGLVVLAIFALAPGQTTTALGWEILVLGAAMLVGIGSATIRELRGIEVMWWALSRSVITVIATVPMVVAGASLVTGAGGGLYWALAEVVGVLATSTYFAWVLLVEIRR